MCKRGREAQRRPVERDDAATPEAGGSVPESTSHAGRVEAVIAAIACYRLTGDAAALAFYVAHRDGTDRGCFASVEKMMAELSWSVGRVKRARRELKACPAFDYRRLGPGRAVFRFVGSPVVPTDGGVVGPPVVPTGEVVGSPVVPPVGPPVVPVIEREGKGGQAARTGEGGRTVDALVGDALERLRSSGRRVDEVPVREAVEARPERGTVLTEADRLAEDARADSAHELRDIAALFRHRLANAETVPDAEAKQWPLSEVEAVDLRTAWRAARVDGLNGARPESLAAGVLYVTVRDAAGWRQVEREAVAALQRAGHRVERVEVVERKRAQSDQERRADEKTLERMP